MKSLAATALLAGLCAWPASAATETQADTGIAAPGAPVFAPESAPVSFADMNVRIDGKAVASDPAPLIYDGAVYVPLRGALEALGMSVDYTAAEKRIEIVQGKKRVVMRAGEPNAVAGTEIVTMEASRMVNGRAFVPLRALAELFGYKVAWISATHTVTIDAPDGMAALPDGHREALAASGPFGVGLDLRDVSAEEVPALLDKARDAGASLIQVRFDWNMLEPARGAEFRWATFDRLVKGARERRLVVVGILGHSARWASVSTSPDEQDCLLSPPREADFPAWSNYVRRTVGRYKNDVHAWQVWENPAASNFRSVARSYRKITRLAAEAARKADPRVIIHGAEPGGVKLDFINDLARNGLTPLLDGISVYPVSQWQPGALNAPESFLLPYATLQEQLQLPDGKRRDYWVGGLGYPTLEVAPAAPKVAASNAPQFGAAQVGAAQVRTVALPSDRPDTAAPAPTARPVTPRAGLLEAFSPQAQAGYLVRSMSLAVATGTGKAIWARLRDVKSTPPLQPINPEAGTGLLRKDGSSRPSYEAFKTLSTQLAGKSYAGNLALGRGLVALLFSDRESTVMVAWSPAGEGRMLLTSTGVDPQIRGAQWVSTRPDSEVLSVTGSRLAGSDVALEMSGQPVFITHVAYETVKVAAARKDGKSLRLEPPVPSYASATQVRAVFDEREGEDGLAWRKYADFGGEARNLVPLGGRRGLATEAQRDIFDLLSARPFIYLDVADDFMYFEKGMPVTVTVEVYRPGAGSGGILNAASGFRIEYDSPSGFKSTPWQEVAPGTGWATYTFKLPDANFANADGYDLLLNANGSKTDLTFGSVVVQRPARQDDAAPPVAPGGTAVPAPPVVSAAPAPTSATAPVTPPVATPPAATPPVAAPAAGG